MTPDFASMTDQELKQYFLAHRENQAAFEAYMGRHLQGQKNPIVRADEIEHLPLNEQMNVVGDRLKARFGLPANETPEAQ